MGKQKSDDKKKKKKNSQLVIRIDSGERDAFVKLCDTLDTSAAREIRRFIRDWVAAHAAKPEAAEQSADVPELAVDAAVAPPEPPVAEPPVAEKPVGKSRRKRPADVAVQ